MAGHCAIINGHKVFIDYPDAEGSAIVNGRVWRWEFHDYLGPTFLKKNGDPRECQCPIVKAVWDAFDKWLKRYDRKKKMARSKLKKTIEKSAVAKYVNPEFHDTLTGLYTKAKLASPSPAPAPVKR